MEVYAVDDDGANTSRLVNTSTRAFVGTGDGVAIPGITVTPEGSRTYLVRAVGRFSIFRGSTDIAQQS